jgi:hypothetical protein
MDAFLARVYDVILQPLIGLMFGVAFLIFIWGVVIFIKDRDSDTGRQTGWRHIGYGILGMVIMISVFGIINIIVGTLGQESPVDQTKLKGDIEDIGVEESL